MESESFRKHFVVLGISWLEFFAFAAICVAHIAWAVIDGQIIRGGNVPDSVSLPRDDILDQLFFLGYNPGVQRAIDGIKWFMLGALAYMVVWVLVVVVVNGLNDIVISESFMHPDSFSKSKYWAAILARLLLRIACVMFLLALALLFVQVLPQVYRYARGGLGDVAIGVSMLFGLQFLQLYLSTVLLRFIFLKRRLLY